MVPSAEEGVERGGSLHLCNLPKGKKRKKRGKTLGKRKKV